MARAVRKQSPTAECNGAVSAGCSKEMPCGCPISARRPSILQGLTAAESDFRLWFTRHAIHTRLTHVPGVGAQHPSLSCENTLPACLPVNHSLSTFKFHTAAHLLVRQQLLQRCLASRRRHLHWALLAVQAQPPAPQHSSCCGQHRPCLQT